MGEESVKRKLAPTEIAFPRARIGPDGSLYFPSRGDAPAGDIQGYTRDQRDKNHFIPKIEPCKYREMFFRKECGCTIQRIECKLLSKSVMWFDCKDCTKREP